ncbi:hypothetical protein N9A14_05045 [Gammaproteobacteria bacterium]|nr:hypothetical protein [Gammaproteobacteria bacterium]
MKKLLLALLIFNCSTIHYVYSGDELDSGDLVELYQDQDWANEMAEMSEIFNALTTLVYFQNNLQASIAENLEEFYADNISNEKLWEELNSIENQIGTFSEDFNLAVMGISTTSASTNPKAISLYKSSLKIIYDANDYQIDNNKSTRDLLSSLAKGDIDNYNYLVSRGSLKNADFLELIANNTRAQGERLPETSIGRHVIMVDSDVIHYVAIAMRVNALQMLNELDKKNYKEYKVKLDNAYKVISKGKSLSNVKKAIANLENTIKELQSLDEDFTIYIEIIERVMVNAKLLSEANIRNAESWKDMMDFYDRNINNITNLYDSASRSAEFDEMQTRQAFIQEQVSTYTDLYQEASAEFIRIAPEFLTNFK